MRDALWDAYEVCKIFVGAVIAVGVPVALLCGAIMAGVSLGLWLS